MPKGKSNTAARGRWTRSAVIREILLRERMRHPLNGASVQGSSASLYQAACRYFGSWAKALHTAGISPSSVRKTRQWDKANVVRHLRALCRKGYSLKVRSVVRRDSGLYRAAAMLFGTWRNAIVAAGINPEPICRNPQWEHEGIIEAILLRAVRGDPLGSTTVRPCTLKSAAVAEFGSWAAALRAAGLDPAEHIGKIAVPKGSRKSRWTKDGVRKAIRQRHAMGFTLSASGVQRDDRALYVGARTCFGSWRNALADSGVEALYRRED